MGNPEEMPHADRHHSRLPPHSSHPHDVHSFKPLGEDGQIEDQLRRFQPPLGKPIPVIEGLDDKNLRSHSMPHQHGLPLPSMPRFSLHNNMGFHRGNAEAEIEEMRLWIEAEEARHEAEVATQEENFKKAIEVEKKRHMETIEVF